METEWYGNMFGVLFNWFQESDTMLWEKCKPCQVYFGGPGAFFGHLGLINCDPA